MVNKLLTGGFRVGVAQGLLLRALAQLAELETPLLAHRLMGGFQPSAAAWEALLAPAEAGVAGSSRPYPFALASPLEAPAAPGAVPLPGIPREWLVEWKWDGVRGQLIHRQGSGFLWSRGEELLNGAFPELIALATALPEGTVLDGEVIVWPPHQAGPPPSRPCSAASAAVPRAPPCCGSAPPPSWPTTCWRRGTATCAPNPCAGAAPPWRTLHGGTRPRPRPPQPGSCASPSPCPWPTGTPWRTCGPSARQAGAEGLMLKQAEAPYPVGRRRGPWWKHKLEPFRLDAVLLYAQAGRGRRANLHTDYTFGLWDPAPGGSEPPALVPFAKAYSGLDDREIQELDRWIRAHTVERFGPVRSVPPEQVFELAFEGVQASRRHRSGLAVRFPRIARWRRDKPAPEADTLAGARRLLPEATAAGAHDLRPRPAGAGGRLVRPPGLAAPALPAALLERLPGGPQRPAAGAHGSGKTYAALMGPVAEMLAEPQPPEGLRLLYLTPLRALSRDLALAIRAPIEAMGWPLRVGIRNGDTTGTERSRQLRQPPQILITTPESLALLLAGSAAATLFERLQAVVLDEWHELLGSKRGSQCELALAWLRRRRPQLRTWAISATLGNLEEAARARWRWAMAWSRRSSRRGCGGARDPQPAAGAHRWLPLGGPPGAAPARSPGGGAAAGGEHAAVHQHPQPGGALAPVPAVRGPGDGGRPGPAPQRHRPGRAEAIEAGVKQGSIRWWCAPAPSTWGSTSSRWSGWCRSAAPATWRGCCSGPAAPPTPPVAPPRCSSCPPMPSSCWR